MLDLFDAPILPGLSMRHAVITPDEEADLIARIEDAGLSPFRFQQWTGKRMTRSWGMSYDFATARLEPTDPIPAWLMNVRVSAANLAGLPAVDLVQAMVTRYGPGAGIGWHRDRSVYQDVVGVSLGAPATMRFRRRVGTAFERATAPLEPRSMYHLGGESRSAWEHSIAGMEATRWSITFRSLRTAAG